ncbi:MAG: hypothetical protein AAF922_13565 [Pseudomonadota bacterium]
MDPHPDFENTELPRSATLNAFALTPLDASAMDEDYAAVTRSEGVLKGLFGNEWPVGLTEKDNLADLHWHDREFKLKRSFSWVIRDRDGIYLGCAYIMPDPGKCGTAQVFTWIRDVGDRAKLNRAFDAELAAWFADVLPGDLTLRWTRPD